MLGVGHHSESSSTGRSYSCRFVSCVSVIGSRETYDSEILRRFGGWSTGAEMFIAIVDSTQVKAGELSEHTMSATVALLPTSPAGY